MPKSAIDATRFTPTTPHASTKPPPPASSPSLNSLPHRTPGPPGETPQLKVRRLREAAARARDAKVSGFEKAVIRGRVWADRAHRFTALSLIGITAIAGVVTVYALGDMMIYNRRKRREYFAEQQALRNAAIHEARTAVRHGSATAEQQALFENEELVRQASEARTAQKASASTTGFFARTKALLFYGLKKEETQEPGESAEAEERMRMMAAGVGTAPGDETGEMEVAGRESAILKAVEERRSEARDQAERVAEREAERERDGGPLDQLGTSLATSETSDSEAPKEERGWTAFMSRR